MVTAKSKQSLKDYILSGEDEIRVENPELEKWIVLIYGIKQLAWSAAIVLVGAGIYATLATGGAAAPVAAGVSGIAAGAVGVSGLSAMIGLGVALGGVSGLTSLRNKYVISDKGEGYVVLHRKK